MQPVLLKFVHYYDYISLRECFSACLEYDIRSLKDVIATQYLGRFVSNGLLGLRIGLDHFTKPRISESIDIWP